MRIRHSEAKWNSLAQILVNLGVFFVWFGGVGWHFRAGLFWLWVLAPNTPRYLTITLTFPLLLIFFASFFSFSGCYPPLNAVKTFWNMSSNFLWFFLNFWVTLLSCKTLVSVCKSFFSTLTGKTFCHRFPYLESTIVDLPLHIFFLFLEAPSFPP